ncbi:hypothetical protein [Bradyrhizobium liaoningense]
MALKEVAGVRKPQTGVESAADVPVWRKTTVGTFPDSVALRNALNARGCGVGELASEIMARPAFTLNTAKADLELVTVSAAELGFQTETVLLGQIYARAQQLGFGLAPAEIAPQLRLQYLDQPIGEFLTIGMNPIKTSKGAPVILNVANGGAGLILIGQDGRADAEIFVGSGFCVPAVERSGTCGDNTRPSLISRARMASPEAEGIRKPHRSVVLCKSVKPAVCCLVQSTSRR